MIGEPPLEAGADHVKLTCWLSGVAVPIVGAPGTEYVVAEAEDAEDGELPAAFTATTVKV